MRRLMQLGAMAVALAALWGSPARAASLEEFGYLNIKADGVENRGSRPLVTVLVSVDGKPALAHDRSYYDNLVYNWTRKSVNGYFLVNSNGRFHWNRAGDGTVGPIRFTAQEAQLGEREFLALLKERLFQSGFDVAQFDENHDGNVTDSELGILMINNNVDRIGGTRPSNPAGVRPSGATVSLYSRVAQVGHRASFMTITHEISHLLGTIDLYGSNDLNQGLTLLDATIYPNDDDMRTYHLDPWHKMQLGWCEPRVYSLRNAGGAVLPAANLVKPDAPVILYDPARGASEYFILEYRSASSVSGLHYDENVADNGLVIWQVKQDGSKMPVLVPGQNGYSDYTMFAIGAPDFVRGGRIAWRSGAQTPVLRWQNGTPASVRLTVRPFAAGAAAITVDWTGAWSPLGPVSGGLKDHNPLIAALAGDPWSGYESLAGGMKGRAVVGQNGDGRLEVFIRGLDDGLWHIWQLPGGGWSGWESLGGQITTDPAVGRNRDGRLEVFARGLDNGLWHIWQTFDGRQPWSGWHSLGGKLIGQPAVGRNADGRLEVFARGLETALWHIWQGGPNDGWSGWESLGGRLTTDPAVGQNGDGRLEVFARGLDNALWHIWQTFQAQPWSGWHSLGGGLAGQPAVGRNADGRLEVFVRGLDAALWHIWQGGPNDGWSGWESLGGQITTDPAVASDRQGRLTVFARGLDNGLWHIDQTFQAKPWSDWQALGGKLTEAPAVGRNGDGRLEVFVRGLDSALYHQWEVSP